MVKSTWASFTLRMQQESQRILANNKDGVAKMTVHIFTDSCGEPLFWWISDPARIEPSSTAKERMSKLFSST